MIGETTAKYKRCRYCEMFHSPDREEMKCVVNGWKDTEMKDTSVENCESCKEFNSMYIEYPIEVNGIERVKNPSAGSMCGRIVKIRPCAEVYGNKTYLGIHLGNLPYDNSVSYAEATKTLKVTPVGNPAIFVPELKKIIFGYESWWGVLKDESELRDITDNDIDKVWYVRMLRSLDKESKGEK